MGRNKPTTAWGVVLWLNMSILISCCCFFLVGLLLNSVYLYIYICIPVLTRTLVSLNYCIHPCLLNAGRVIN